MDDDDLAYYEQLQAEQEEAEMEAALEHLRHVEQSTKTPTPPPVATPPPVVVEEAPDVEKLVIDEPEVGQKRLNEEIEVAPEPPKKRSKRPKRTIVLSNPPLDADSIKLISEEGEMRFLRKMNQLEAPTVSEKLDASNLLGCSISDLRLTAYQERAEADERRHEETQQRAKIKENHAKIDWISKYRAQQYTELLSDESTNRAILKWLKMWEPCVFKIKRKAKKKEEKLQETFGRKFKGKTKWKTREEHLEDKAQEESEADELNRPKYKVLMLAGPPGLGKTTLAHVAAMHSGYRPTELNASDDRAGDNFRNRVNQALTNQNANDKRPNCLILDEIDGIHGPAASYLIKRVTAAKSKVGDGEAKKGKKKDLPPLMRPIIAICNDPFVPALRELREHTIILHFNGVDRSRLTTRLEDVCKLNHVKIERSALAKLAVKTEDDIRSCINALQFLSMNNSAKQVTMGDIDKINMGKDQQRGLQYALKEILSISTVQSVTDRFTKSQEVARSFGDTGKLASAIFENVGEVKPPSLESAAQSREWYSWWDRIERFINKSQNYQLYPVKELIIPALHLLLAQNGTMHENLKLSKQSWEIFKKHQDCSNLLKMMVAGLALQTKANFIGHALVQELPLLLKIAEPVIRSVNPALWSKQEKAAIQHCVNVMVDLGLSMKQARDHETQQVEFVIEPPVFHVAQFPTESTVKQFTLSNATKTLLSAEIEREKIRRSEAHRHKHNQVAEISPAMRAVIMPPRPKALTKDKIQRKKKTAFAGFTKTKKSTTKAPSVEHVEKKPIDPGIGNSDIFFKFNTGYSNAVRQVIKIKELF